MPGLRPRAVTWLPGALITVMALLVVLFGFTVWVTVTNPGTTSSTITGWGTIDGVEGISGQNINDVIASLDGSGSYRPALIVTALAGLAFLAGIRIIFVQSRIAAAAAGACGLFIAAWALFRALVPGDVAGIVEAGGAGAGVGPWLTFVAGLVIVLPAALVMLRPVVRPAPQLRTRGIQPRR